MYAILHALGMFVADMFKSRFRPEGVVRQNHLAGLDNITALGGRVAAAKASRPLRRPRIQTG
jgi:hypothetical protein